jgi:hypothetical protein
MIKSLFALVALALCACQSCHPVIGPFPPDPAPAPQPDPPSPWDAAPDAGPPAPPPAPAPAGACAAACSRLAALGCPEAKPTPNGATCTDVCLNAEDSGVLSMQTDCVVQASDCPAARACAAIPQ